MSELVEINNKKYLAIKSAAKQVSYSKDYLAKLAREKKVLAIQVGRQWFINMSSLQGFVDSMNLEQAIRKQNLSEQRKRELSIKSHLQKISDDLDQKIFKTKKYSLVISSLVLVVGFFLGNVISTYTSMSGFYEFTDAIKPDTKIDLLALISKDSVAKDSDVSTKPKENEIIINEDLVYPVFIDYEEVRAMKTDVGGILLWVNEEDDINSDYVKQLFSDPIEVEFSSNNSGFIRYDNEKVYPFVAVPNKLNRNTQDLSNNKL